MVKGRILWVDTAKYIAIMCVLAVHLESMTDELHALFAPFFLPLFFFCSGYVYSGRHNFVETIKKKAKQLLVPWLILSLAIILLAHVFSFNNHKSLLEELYWNFLQIRGKDDEMWFVAALFVAYIPFYFLIRWYSHSRNITLFLLLTLSLSLISKLYIEYMEPGLLPWGTVALPWHLEYIFQAIFFMVLGFIFRDKWEERFDNFNHYVWIVLFSVIYVVIVYGPSLLGKTEVLQDDPIILEYIKQLLGVFVCVAISKKMKPTKYILYIGQNTLLCFALHGKLFSLIQVCMRSFFGGMYSYILDNTLYSSLFAIICAFSMSIILILPIFLINRYAPIVAGKPMRIRS